MNDLIIKYSIPQRIKVTTLLVSAFLTVLAFGLAIVEALNNRFAFYFFVGLAGIIIGILGALSVTIWLSELRIEINGNDLIIKLPKQRINGLISWENVSQIGIGLSMITITAGDKNYKIDFGNLKYNDLRDIKTKLIEVCESKNIAFSNTKQFSLKSTTKEVVFNFSSNPIPMERKKNYFIGFEIIDKNRTHKTIKVKFVTNKGSYSLMKMTQNSEWLRQDNDSKGYSLDYELFFAN